MHFILSNLPNCCTSLYLYGTFPCFMEFSAFYGSFHILQNFPLSVFCGIFHVLWNFPCFAEVSVFRFLRKFRNFPRFMEFSMFCGSFRFPFFVEFSAFYGSFVWYNLIFPYLFRILWKFCIFLFISSAIFHAIYEIYDLADKKRVDFIVARHAFCITKYHLARGHP